MGERNILRMYDSCIHPADPFIIPNSHINSSLEYRRKTYRLIFNNHAKIQIRGAFEWQSYMYTYYERSYNDLINSLNGTSLIVTNPTSEIANEAKYGEMFIEKNSFCEKCGNNYIGYFRNKKEDKESIEAIVRAVEDSIFGNGDFIDYLIKPSINNGYKMIKEHILEEVAFEIGFRMFEIGKPFIFINC